MLRTNSVVAMFAGCTWQSGQTQELTRPRLPIFGWGDVTRSSMRTSASAIVLSASLTIEKRILIQCSTIG